MRQNRKRLGREFAGTHNRLSAASGQSSGFSNFRSEQFVQDHGRLHTDKECDLSESLLIPLLDVAYIGTYIGAVFAFAARSLKCGGSET